MPLDLITRTLFLSLLVFAILLYPANGFDINNTVRNISHIGFIGYDMHPRSDYGTIGYEISSNWNDPRGSCNNNFECNTNFTTGWQDNASLQVSTKVTTKNTYSWIYGKEIQVYPSERYELVTHMKLNKFATQSHIAIEAFNETLKNWEQIKQCPPRINGILTWHEFSCEVTIPERISKMRPVLIAGWSSQANEEAVTFFDDINLSRLTDANFTSNVLAINDPNLKTEVVVEGLELPTSMAFLGPDDILVLEKNKGTVQRIINGTMLPEPLLDVNVGNVRERGMLGIAVSKHGYGPSYVFLYFTQAKTEDGDDRLGGEKPLGNRLYRYELINDKLVNPKLLLDLPTGTVHNGGAIMVGPDSSLYIPVGDLEESFTCEPACEYFQAQNITYAKGPDGRGGILRVTQDGEAVAGILDRTYPVGLYYAYGIRNSFGIDFDPITGKLWDTENGPNYGDEINLVEPGFNSGSQVVQGMALTLGEKEFDLEQLVDFDGRGKYSDPEYEWSETVGPTALKFLNSDKLGKEYENDMFVADTHNGNIYHFELNKERTKIILDSALEGRVNEKIIFAKGFGGITEEGFGGITDIEVGPDGYLYIVSFGQGKIFRIVPQSTNPPQ